MGFKQHPLESPMNQQQVVYKGLTSTKAGSQMMFKDFQEFTNQRIDEGGQQSVVGSVNN